MHCLVRSLAAPTSLLVASCVGGTMQAGYVEGVVNGEDLVPIPGTKWIVASGLDGPGQPGRLTLIDRERKFAGLLFSGDSPVSADRRGNDREGDPACPGPLQPGKFGAHGIALRKTGATTGTLYAVNHTGREAVELFAIDWSGKGTAIAWTGCIPLPKGVLSNAVAPLPDGGIAVTHMNAPEYFDRPAGRDNPEVWIPKFIVGETTGYAATWRAGEGWRKVAGTEGSVPNGIEVSPDGRWLFVNLWGNSELRRVPLERGEAKTVKLDFLPDNLRWGDDGRLWTAGPVGERKDYFACTATRDCHNDWRVAGIDPASLTVEEIDHPDTRPAFGDATSAVKVGGEIWIGSNPSQRVAVLSPGK